MRRAYKIDMELERENPPRMRARRRSSSGAESRVRAVPARSRVTVRKRPAPMARTGQLAAALRTSREALTDLTGELDALLALLRDPAGAAPDGAAAERLHGAARQVGSAFATLGALARHR